MFDLTILEVAIGLAFVYLLLSLVVSGLSEIVSQFLGLRSANLSKWVLLMFDPRAEVDEANMSTEEKNDSDAERRKAKKCVEKFYGLARIQSLIAPGPTNPISRLFSKLRLAAGKSRPSYIRANTFASSMIDLIVKPDGTARSVASLKEGISNSDELPQTAKDLLIGLVNEAGTLDNARKNIEEWYDDAMDRVSGWYKRQAQLILLAIGVVLALVVNVNSFEIADSLWRNDTLRASVVAAAEERAATDFGNDSAPADVEATVANAAAGQTTASSGFQDEDPEGTTEDANPYEDVADDIASLNALNIPIGWDDPPNTATGIFAMLAGIAFTALAISLGAPFWFDALNKLVNMRGSGKPPATEKN